MKLLDKLGKALSEPKNTTNFLLTLLTVGSVLADGKITKQEWNEKLSPIVFEGLKKIHIRRKQKQDESAWRAKHPTREEIGAMPEGAAKREAEKGLESLQAYEAKRAGNKTWEDKLKASAPVGGTPEERAEHAAAVKNHAKWRRNRAARRQSA